MANISLCFNHLECVKGLISGKYEWITTLPTPNTDLVAMGFWMELIAKIDHLKGVSYLPNSLELAVSSNVGGFRPDAYSQFFDLGEQTPRSDFDGTKRGNY
jgi:hypothetical protein